MKNGKAFAALLSIYIVWGTTYLAIRIGVSDLPPVLFTGLRWIIAGPILFIILWLRKESLPNLHDIIHLGISGLLLIGLGNGLVVYAEQYVPSGLTALLITTVPFWMVGIDSLLPHGRKINFHIFIGLILGLVGTSFIFGGDIKSLLNKDYLVGIISLMIGVVGWSLGTLYSKYKKVSTKPLMSAAIQMTVAGTIVTLIGFIIGEGNTFHFTHQSLLAYLYLVLVGSLVGYGSYVYALAHLPVSLVSTYAYINPIIALFLGWLILNEEISVWVFIAAVVILFGVMMVKKGSEKNKI